MDADESLRRLLMIGIYPGCRLFSSRSNTYLYLSFDIDYQVNEKIIVYGRVNSIYFSCCFIFNYHKVMVFEK